MLANSGLDAGLFISTDEIIIWLEGFTLPLLLIKIKYFPGFFNEFGISWINREFVKPRTDSIFMQPLPDARIAY